MTTPSRDRNSRRPETSEQDGATQSQLSDICFDGFPFTPYKIQQQLMGALYTLLKKGGVGLFESPTGTGKTLSLICGALKWLEETKHSDEQAAQATPSQAQDGQAALPAWLLRQSEAKNPPAAASRTASTISLAKGTSSGRHSQRPVQKPLIASDKGRDDLSEFDLPAWHEHEEAPPSKKRRLSADSASSEADSGEEVEEPRQFPQILFCSRTHSQLSQFVGELRRTKYKDSMSLAALASRQTLCINKDVLDLGSGPQINERCVDLQDAGSKQLKSGKGKKSGRGCPYLFQKPEGRQPLKEAILQQPMDVEELGSLGSRKATCPYYAARSAQPAADLVLLPYSALLSKDARESLGIKLQSSVIIVDEAHNLVSAVHDTHSASLSSQQLANALGQLTAYHLKFQSRLAPGNDQNVQMLIHVAEKLVGYFENAKGQGTEAEAKQAGMALTINDFLFSTGIDNVNLFQLLRFVKETRLIYRVSGYSMAKAAKEMEGTVLINERAANDMTTSSDSKTDKQASIGRGALQTLVTFLGSLNNCNADGRIILDSLTGTCKFILLNGASQFSKILESAHAVVLASGTLSPTESLRRQLFPNRQVESFSCGHIIRDDRLLALAIGSGPSGAPLNFKHGQRSQTATVDQLGRLLLNICQAVPQGVVVFFPSFAYREEVQRQWASYGLIRQLSARKKVFVEPRATGQVESMLRDYSECIAGKGSALPMKGAVLLCVVGGKMSEGINFGDGLGRCVLMVGMPYPNAHDPEIVERMHSLDLEDSAGPEQHYKATAGQTFYEDLCMKAVNQCIGRVIRHKDDWAAIILADARWLSPTVGSHNQLKLPGWIQASLHLSSSFGDAYSRLTRFCRSMA